MGLGVGGNWAGDGTKRGFPDMNSKRLILFFLWKNASITHRKYEPKKTKLSKKPPITHAEFN